MAHYPRRRSGTDDYAASRALFDALITRMGEREMNQRPEHAMEEFITDAGRDVLQQMLQVLAPAGSRAPRGGPVGDGKTSERIDSLGFNAKCGGTPHLHEWVEPDDDTRRLNHGA